MKLMQPGAAPSPTGAATTTPKTTGTGTTADKSKITIEGNKLDDVTRALSGLGNIQPTPQGVKQMLSPASQGVGGGAAQGLSPAAGIPDFLLPR